MGKSNGNVFIRILKKIWSIFHSIVVVLPINLILENIARKPPISMALYSPRPNDTAIVTGGNKGIGAEIVRKLLEVGMHVIVGVRNFQEMQAVLKNIREGWEINTGSLEIIHLDLNYLASVRAFANEIIEKGIPIHILINNAGVMGGSKIKKTPDDNEEMLQVNALAPFLLNNLLLTQLVGGGTHETFSSIVDVSSISQYYGKIDFDDLNCMKWYDKKQAYANSKLIQTALNSYLGNKLKDYGIKVRANSVHPGICGTSFFYNLSWNFRSLGFIYRLLANAVAGTPENGADEVIHIALDPEVAHITGKYFIRGKVDPEVPKLSTKVMEKLWDTACEKVGIENVFRKIIPSSELKFQDLDTQEELESTSAIGPKKPRGLVALQTTPADTPEVVPAKLHVQYPNTYRWEGKRMQNLFKSSTVAPSSTADNNTTTTVSIAGEPEDIRSNHSNEETSAEIEESVYM